MKTTSTLQQKLTVSFRLFLKFIHKILLFFGIKDFAKWALPHAACVLIENKSGKILAVSRKNDFTKFSLPGGKREKNETSLETAVRELKEETGVVVYDSNKLKKILEEPDGFGYWVTCYKYMISLTEIENLIIKPNDHETGIVKWIDRQELLHGSFSMYNEKALDLSSIFLVS